LSKRKIRTASSAPRRLAVRGVHRGVAAADDADHPAEHWRAALLDLLQERDGVDHLAAVHRRHVEMIGELRADAEEHRIEAALLLFGQNVGDPVVAHDLHAHRLDAGDLLGQPLARQAIGGHAVAHHAARLLAAVADLDVMSQPAQVVGAGQARGAGANHQHALAGGRPWLDRPAFFQRQVAQEAIDRVDRHRLIEKLPIASAFTRMVAGAPVRPGKRIFFHVLAPGVFPLAGLSQREPRLDVQARRTAVVAGRQMIDIRRRLPARRVGALGDGRLVDRRHVLGDQCHRESPGSAANRKSRLAM
jgi:hypothetical protein